MIVEYKTLLQGYMNAGGYRLKYTHLYTKHLHSAWVADLKPSGDCCMHHLQQQQDAVPFVISVSQSDDQSRLFPFTLLTHWFL
jgi:hypothetical protein